MAGLMAIIGANADPMRREFKEVERMAMRTGRAIQTSMGGSPLGHGARGGVIGETLVLFRELGRGNFARIPGSLTILIQRLGILKYVFKDTAVAANALATAQEAQAAKAMLAAAAAKEVVRRNEANAATMLRLKESEIAVMAADRAKAASALQVAEAERVQAVAARQAAVATQELGVASRFSLGPIGWIIIGVTALATALYFTWKHIKTTTEQARTLRDMLDVANVKFTDQAEIMKDHAIAAQSNVDWLNKLAEAQEGVADATEDALKAQREQFKYQRELAEHKGASKKQLAQMDIAEAQKELDIVNEAKLKARRQLEIDKSEEQKAFDAANNDHRSGRIKTLNERSHGMGSVIDDIQRQMRDAGTMRVIDEAASRISATAGGGPVYKYRAANADDKFTVKVDGKEVQMSLNEAKEAWTNMTRQAEKLEKVQKELADILESKKKLTEKENESVLKLQRESQELASDLALKKKYLPQLSDIGSFKHGHVNALQQIGGYAAPAVDIQRGMLHHLANIDRNTSRGTATAGATHERGVRF